MGVKWITPEEARSRIGLGRATVYKMCRAYQERWCAEGRSAYDPPEPLPEGELPCIRVGARKLRIPVAMLERMNL